jgi:hypothetical protein
VTGGADSARDLNARCLKFRVSTGLKLVQNSLVLGYTKEINDYTAMIIGCSESIIFKKQNQIRNFYFLFLIVYGYQLQKCADTAPSCD